MAQPTDACLPSSRSAATKDYYIDRVLTDFARWHTRKGFPLKAADPSNIRATYNRIITGAAIPLSSKLVTVSAIPVIYPISPAIMTARCDKPVNVDVDFRESHNGDCSCSAESKLTAVPRARLIRAIYNVTKSLNLITAKTDIPQHCESRDSFFSPRLFPGKHPSLSETNSAIRYSPISYRDDLQSNAGN